MGKHTPTPWDWKRPYEGSYGDAWISASGGERIAVCGELRKPTIHGFIGQPDYTEVEANAAFIVRACNAHEELVRALHLARNYVLDATHFREHIKQIDAALTKAREEHSDGR